MSQKYISMATNGNTFICLRVLVQVFKKRTVTSQKKSFHRKTITILLGGATFYNNSQWKYFFVDKKMYSKSICSNCSVIKPMPSFSFSDKNIGLHKNYSFAQKIHKAVEENFLINLKVHI